MSDRTSAATTCTKRRFRDRIAALLAIESHGRQKPRHKDTVRAYRCPDCKGWHLTSQPTWRRKHGSEGAGS